MPQLNTDVAKPSDTPTHADTDAATHVGKKDKKMSGKPIKKADDLDNNPLLTTWSAPFELPPFDAIEDRHFQPAIEEGLRRHRTEINAIVDNSERPSFKNTIEALEKSGEAYERAASVFYNLLYAHTNDTIQQTAETLAPIISSHFADINLNSKLFDRVAAVYHSDRRGLSAEECRLLELSYDSFVRRGAKLTSDDALKLRSIDETLSLSTLQFGNNLRKATNVFALEVNDPERLKGLPPSTLESCEAEAKKRDLDSTWALTLDRPTLRSVLLYCENREVRQTLYQANNTRCSAQSEYDNTKLVPKMAKLRAERATLLGFDTAAAFILDENMAKKPSSVYALLDQLWAPALSQAKAEAIELQALAQKDGIDTLQPFDWAYYAEKLRRAKFDLDDAELRPYFSLQKVRDGAFVLAEELFGVSFLHRKDLPVYAEGVTVFEVKDTSTNEHLGVFYLDYHPRPSKSGGAWMNALRMQCKHDGRRINPVILNVCNFSKASSNEPSLLTFSEVETLFHEFGHALHGLLSQCHYAKLSGTAVCRDFVELPSQIMENWAAEPAMLKRFAKHWKTGEVITDEILKKMEAAKHFNEGFATTSYLAACYLDMAWHTMVPSDIPPSPEEFENAMLLAKGLPQEIGVRYRSQFFSHIFAGGYAAGYYGYIYAEVLDADAFGAFKEEGLFNPATGRRWKEVVLERGNTALPMDLFKTFRGREPRVDALLKRKGFAA